MSLTGFLSWALGVVGVLLAAGSGPLLAAPSFSLAAGGDGRWFDWRESIDGHQVLAETGPQVLGVGQLAVMSGPWRASVESQWGGGMTRYDGHLQTGAPYVADASEAVVDTDWRIAWRNESGEVSLGVLQRDWRRLIEGSTTVSSAEERYRWRLLVWGMAATVVQTPSWSGRISARVGMPVERKQKLYLGGSYDDATLEPGNGLYWRLAFPLQGKSESRLSLEPYFQEQRMQQSEAVVLTRGGVPTGLGVYQPASARRELGVTLRWQLLP